MKQVYVKPRIIVERFALTQSIASGCGVVGGSTLGNPTHQNKYDCAWNLGGQLIFMEGMSQCSDIPVKEDGEITGICYNNPDGAMIFASF